MGGRHALLQHFEGEAIEGRVGVVDPVRSRRLSGGPVPDDDHLVPVGGDLRGHHRACRRIRDAALHIGRQERLRHQFAVDKNVESTAGAALLEEEQLQLVGAPRDQIRQFQPPPTRVVTDRLRHLLHHVVRGGIAVFRSAPAGDVIGRHHADSGYRISREVRIAGLPRRTGGADIDGVGEAPLQVEALARIPAGERLHQHVAHLSNT